MQVLHLLRKVAREENNERNSIHGGKVRQEEHDLLPEMRKKDYELEQEKMRFVRIREKQEDKGL